jgi:hypothetical protein
MSCGKFSVDPVETLFVSNGLCPGPADGSQFVRENNSFGKESPFGFFKDHKKIFICLNTLSENRIFFDSPGLTPLSFVCIASVLTALRRSMIRLIASSIWVGCTGFETESSIRRKCFYASSGVSSLPGT